MSAPPSDRLATGVLLFGNLYVSNRERSPLFKGGVHAALVKAFRIPETDRELRLV